MEENKKTELRVNRKKKGWVLEAGFLQPFLEKNYPKDAHIIDIGCGPGHWLMTLHEMGYTNIHGIDLDNFIVFPEIKNLDIHRKADVSYDKLPFEDSSVDVILSFQVFEHLENPFHFERECRRVLKPGGLLIMSYPYGWSLQSRLKFLLTCDVMGYRLQNSHINFMTKAIFDKCFIKDFSVIRKEFFHGRLGLFGKAIYLPANKYFGNGICFFLEKRYNR